MKGCKLSSVALGLALGVLWGLSTLIMGLLDHHYAYGHSFVSTMGTVYPGYVPTIGGSILGGIIGLINGFITGFLISWLYNVFSCCACLCCDTSMRKNKVVSVKKDTDVKAKAVKGKAVKAKAVKTKTVKAKAVKGKAVKAKMVKATKVAKTTKAIKKPKTVVIK